MSQPQNKAEVIKEIKTWSEEDISLLSEEQQKAIRQLKAQKIYFAWEKGNFATLLLVIFWLWGLLAAYIWFHPKSELEYIYCLCAGLGIGYIIQLIAKRIWAKIKE